MYIPVFSADDQPVLIWFYYTDLWQFNSCIFKLDVIVVVFWVVVFLVCFILVCVWKMNALFFGCCFLTLVTAFFNTMYSCIGTTMFGLSSELNIELTCIVCLSVLFNFLCVLIWVVQCCETVVLHFSVGYFHWTGRLLIPLFKAVIYSMPWVRKIVNKCHPCQTWCVVY